MWHRLQILPLAVPATVAVLALGLGLWLLIRWIRSGMSAAERERRRRIHIHVKGRMTEATVLQADDHEIQYTYQVAGVAYSASQDIGALVPALPCRPEYLIGTGLAKYDPRNPANSIVLCEHWMGLRGGTLNQVPGDTA